MIDTDTGIDDALALLVVLTAEEVNLIGLGSTYGNCPAHTAARNACCVLEVAGRTEIPVATGLAQPPDSWVPAAAEVHGPDGLGNRSWHPSLSASTRENAVQQLLRLSREHAGRLELLALGPLTNIAAALQQDPEVLARCARVVIMGGMGRPDHIAAITSDYPNYQVVGDPNTWHNPTAAEVVTTAEGNITWVGMNVTGRVHVPQAVLTDAAARQHSTAEFVAGITEYYSDFVTRTSGATKRVFTIHDTIAASVLLDPKVIDEQSGQPVAVDYTRDPRGGVWATSAAEPARPAHDVITEVDVGAIIDRVQSTISA